jgi:hypothetical protein
VRKGEGAWSAGTAVHVRDIVKLVSPSPSCMARRSQPRRRSWPGVDRDLRAEGPIPVPAEIRIMLSQIEHVATLPTIRLG